MLVLNMLVLEKTMDKKSTNLTLVTGVAGFIGFHLAQKLLEEGYQVLGVDNLNDYYDVELKKARLGLLEEKEHFSFKKIDVSDRGLIEKLFQSHCFERVFHLAAQAGVRYSITNPHIYLESNLSGFLNILEGCRYSAVKHLIFASSSSVYGANSKIPFSEKDNTDHPLSLYGATKKANEIMAHSYAHLYHFPCTGLRFFTVYGPWGRPDMAIYLFTQAILEGKPIQIFNHGKMERDFTYIDDIIEGIIRISVLIPASDFSHAPYQIYNIGHSQPVLIERVIEILEQELGKKAEKRYLPMQPGDALATYADVKNLFLAVGFKAKIPIEAGLSNFVRWFKYVHSQSESKHMKGIKHGT
jgi:UDP-glucuronate 4-epimerase